MTPTPFPINTLVQLKRKLREDGTYEDEPIVYRVLSVQEGVITDNTTGHISNPGGEAQHFYKLEREGKVAFWWHSQLEQSP
ncbi:hypothetical protein HY772_10165 [Candidatus Woesearchaeota archaeon]|nr:hypothetical protein [Candidatus Woesearchaeota archaeon]